MYVDAWNFQGGRQCSAEATALASLACWDCMPNLSRRAILEGFGRRQLANGHWAPVSPVGSPANWPTALIASTLLQIHPQHSSLPLALSSLVAATPQEASWFWRMKFRVADRNVRFDPSKYGWGWTTGTRSWTLPTAMGIIALSRGRDRNLITGRAVDQRLERAYSMLVDRMCPGGGWNAGNSVVYGVALRPNIEATAIALAALRPHHFEGTEPSLSFLVSAECQSAYSLAWKILALREYAKDRPELRTTLEQFRGKLKLLVEDPRQIEDNATLALSVLAIEGRRSPLAVGATI
jgi:hypothetical protein